MVSETVISRYKALHQACQKWLHNPRAIPLEERELLATICAGTFREFKDFAEIGMQKLGFKLSDIQEDIAEYMQYGPRKRMVQAQRGQAKTTLAAFYCIWLLMNKPSTRVLIVSGGGAQADDISILVTRLIMDWSILCWMRPDTTRGDRDSATNFDVHRDLKGIDKTASVVSVGITASLTGKRADFLLADDIETPKNSMTQPMRETLLERTKEFAALCITGEIMYLGTPQTKDSVYRSLPQRGYDVRIWTGRYPTQEELERYGAGTQVAPSILQRLLTNPELQTGGGVTGKRGQPTDPNHISESTLQDKELDYGEEGFNLQYMLDTTLSDALRTKIKLSDMVVLGVGPDSAPESVQWTADPKKRYTETNPAIANFSMYFGAGASEQYVKYEHKVMTIDPAGDGGDELAFAIGGATNSFIYLLSVGGFRGGLTEDNMNKIIARMVQYGVKDLQIEKNMGHGAVTALFIAQLDKLRLNCSISSQDEKFLEFLTLVQMKPQELYSSLSGVGVSDYHVTGQKEKRIIDTISPVTRRHKLIVSTQAIQDDWELCLQHPAERRVFYSAFYQLGNITYDRQSLVKDDRADAVQALVERLQGFLAKDEAKVAVERQEAAVKEWMQNPMGYNDTEYRNSTKRNRFGSGSTMNRRSFGRGRR